MILKKDFHYINVFLQIVLSVICLQVFIFIIYEFVLFIFLSLDWLEKHKKNFSQRVKDDLDTY